MNQDIKVIVVMTVLLVAVTFTFVQTFSVLGKTKQNVERIINSNVR